MVCLGNICRSPMAEVVMSAKVQRSGLAGRVLVTSSGTGDWHVGDAMDRRAAATLVRHGYDPRHHRGAQFDARWLTRNDLVLTMDQNNLAAVRALGGNDPLNHVRPFRSFDPLAGEDMVVPDPWYGGQAGFDEVLTLVERTTDNLLDELTRLLG